MPAQLSSAEKRTHPRYRTNLDARLSGTLVAMRNVSHTGVQVACNAMFFALLRPRLMSRTAQLELVLADRRLRLECEVVYVNEHDDEMLVGLRLVEGGSDLPAFRTYVAGLAGSAPAG